MAFLFKSKKHQNNALPPANRDIHTSEGPKPSVPAVDGIKENEKTGGPVQNTTPNSSVNNSLNSLGGAGAPSPEQISGVREKPEQDSQVSFPNNYYGRLSPSFA